MEKIAEMNVAKVFKQHRQMLDVLNYVADMTYCGSDAEWHFKTDYDPRRVLDVLAAVGDSHSR